MARRPGATQEEVRRRNLSTLLRHVHLRGALSRAELTNLMGLNRSTIKTLVADLEQAGLVGEEVPETRLGVGRPSHLVVPRRPSVHVLAANIGVDDVSVAAVGLGGVVLARGGYSMAGLGGDPAVIVRRLAAELAEVQGRLPAGGPLAGVGVGVPGVVRQSDGHVEFAPNLGWRGVPLRRMLSDHLRRTVPLRVGNDGDLGALAEHARGTGQGIDNLIYIAGEVGVGGGLILDGRPALGYGGYAGEIGHMIVKPGGRPCRCGSTGCLETEIGEDALLVACGRAPGGGRDAVREVILAAAAGDPGALRGFHDIAGWLAHGLASLVNIFNPELIILGGPLASVLEVAGPALDTELDRLARLPARGQVRLAVPGLGPDSSLIGAAELAFEDLLADPVDDAAVSAG